MLVLTRIVGESLFISDNITITVLKTKDGQIRLGIHAPREVNVVRAELLERGGNRPEMNDN